MGENRNNKLKFFMILCLCRKDHELFYFSVIQAPPHFITWLQDLENLSRIFIKLLPKTFAPSKNNISHYNIVVHVVHTYLQLTSRHDEIQTHTWRLMYALRQAHVCSSPIYHVVYLHENRSRPSLKHYCFYQIWIQSQALIIVRKVNSMKFRGIVSNIDMW